MELLTGMIAQDGMLGKIVPFLPNIFFILITIGAMIYGNKLADFIYRKLTKRFGWTSPTIRMGIKAAIYVVGIVLVILNIPGLKKEFLQLSGLVFGGIVAFSSSTIIANGMGGILIKLMKQYQIGDVIEFEGTLGKVTEIQAFHTEIETPERKLMTIPNSVMLSKKFSNLSETGCIVSAEVGLGYDIPRTTVEKILIKAAKTVGLENPFVGVTALNDYTIGYKLNAVLKDVNLIMGAKSMMYKEVLDEFSKQGLEIVSPMFLNTMAIDPKKRVMAVYSSEETTEEIKAKEKQLGALMFEKAHKKEELIREKEKIADSLQDLIKQQENLDAALEKVKDDNVKKRLELRKKELEVKIKAAQAKVEQHQEKTQKQTEEEEDRDKPKA